jgi:hypothetical protein
MGAPRDETEGNAEHWLLDFQLPGRVFRVTTSPTELLILDKPGKSYLYRPGLARPTVAKSAGEVGAAAISITSSELDGWPLLAKRGHPFNMSRAVLRHHFEGQLLGQSEIYLRGRVVGPSWATKDDALSFRLERQLRRSGDLPSPAMRIDDQTFDPLLIDPRIYGAVGPVVVGTPGKIEGSIACPITPAYLVRYDGVGASTNRFLIAYHRVAATSVTLHDLGPSPTGPAALTVHHDIDLLGRTYAYVDTSSSWMTTNLGSKHLVAWDVGGGGALNRTQTGALVGAGEILLWLLRTWAPGIKIDEGRMAAWQAALDVYLLGAGITTAIPVWSFIQSNILPLLPVDMIEGDDGLYFRPRTLIANPDQIRAHWDSTPLTGNVTRPPDSRLESSGIEIANEITVDFGLGGSDRRYLRSTTVTAKGAEGDGRRIGNWRCEQSQNLYADPDGPADSGIRPLQITTGVVYDQGTGERIALDKATEQALPGQRLVLLVGVEWDDVNLGDTIVHTNAELHHDREPAVLRRKTPILDGFLMELRFTTEAWGARRTTE